MAVTATPEKETGSLYTDTVPYFAHDRDATSMVSKADLVAAALSQALTDQGVAAQDYRFKRLNYRTARVQVLYRPTRIAPLTPPGIGTVEAGFDFTMGPIERQVGIERIDVYGAAGMDDYGGLINVPGGGMEAHGVRLAAPPQVIWRRWTAATAQLSVTYINAVAGLVGTVNSLDLFGLPDGTACLVRASGSQRDADSVTLYFGWSYFPKVENETWGQFSISYDPFDYVWARTRNGVLGDTGNRFLAAEVEGIYVERILYRANHNLLLIPGTGS